MNVDAGIGVVWMWECGFVEVSFACFAYVCMTLYDVYESKSEVIFIIFHICFNCLAKTC